MDIIIRNIEWDREEYGKVLYDVWIGKAQLNGCLDIASELGEKICDVIKPYIEKRLKDTN